MVTLAVKRASWIGKRCEAHESGFWRDATSLEQEGD